MFGVLSSTSMPPPEQAMQNNSASATKKNKKKKKLAAGASSEALSDLLHQGVQPDSNFAPLHSDAGISTSPEPCTAPKHKNTVGKGNVRASNRLANVATIFGLLLTTAGSVVVYRSLFDDIWTLDTAGYILIMLGSLFTIIPPILLHHYLCPNPHKALFEFELLNKKQDDDMKAINILLDTHKTPLPHKATKLLHQKMKDEKKEHAAKQKEKEKQRKEQEKQEKQAEKDKKKTANKSIMSTSSAIAVDKDLTPEEQEERKVEQVKAMIAAGLDMDTILSRLRPKRCYVFDFDADSSASELPVLREFVSFVVRVADPAMDHVCIRLTSPGGLVPNYGLCAAQLARLRKANIRVVSAVDMCAASGGYMMACVTDHIIASPFAFVGSIGVVCGMPNLHKLMKKNDVDYHLFTAGRYKRTVTMFSEVNDESKSKFQEDMNSIHVAFKSHVATHRAHRIRDIEKVATGEHWLASQALEIGLVDELMTSDEYIHQQCCADVEVIHVKPARRKMAGLFGSFSELASASMMKLRQQLVSSLVPASELSALSALTNAASSTGLASCNVSSDAHKILQAEMSTETPMVLSSCMS